MGQMGKDEDPGTLAQGMLLSLLAVDILLLLVLGSDGNRVLSLTPPSRASSVPLVSSGLPVGRRPLPRRA